ncbi:unnamed protein product [Closterium sp. NIES-65]|nr:unnamed protein product [Closterium sp. NIES-65]
MRNVTDNFTRQRSRDTRSGIRIDSGGMKNFTDNFTRQWSRDTGFTSGMAGTLNLTGEPNEFNMPMYQKTTRYYLFALENCYEMPVPAGHYLIRMFFNPGPPNERGDPFLSPFDPSPSPLTLFPFTLHPLLPVFPSNLPHPLRQPLPLSLSASPSLLQTREFAVSTLSTQIAMITPRTPGEFREMMVTYPGPNAELDVCFVANPSALSAFVNALEILPIDPEAYVTDPNYILFNYVRLRTGKGMSFGDGVSLPDKDKGHRQWFNMSTAKLLNEPVTVRCEPACASLLPPLFAFPRRLPLSLLPLSSEPADLPISVSCNQSVQPTVPDISLPSSQPILPALPSNPPHPPPQPPFSPPPHSSSCEPTCTYLSVPPATAFKGADVEPHYFPSILYSSAITNAAGGKITFKVTIPDKGSRVLVVLHFAEIDPSEFCSLLIPSLLLARVFSIFVNRKPTPGGDSIDLITRFKLDCPSLLSRLFPCSSPPTPSFQPSLLLARVSSLSFRHCCRCSCLLYLSVTAAGARVFSIFVNGKPTPNGDNVDLIKWGKASKVALFKTVDWQLGPDESTVEIVLAGAEGASKGPTVAGLEVFRLVSRGPRTNADEFKLMRKIREALVVPEMSNWQGDPCAPIAWPGVGCRLTEKNDFSITGITLSAAELSGSLLPDIHLLKNLQYLDLSANDLKGSIPRGFSSMPALKILDLHDNELTGGVPADLFPPPPGVMIDFSNNPDVCGTTTRPACEALGGPGVSDITIVQPTSSSVSSTQIVWIITACILGVLLIIAVVVAIRLIFFQPHLPLEDDDNGNGGFYSNAHRGHFLEDDEPPYVATLDEEAR